jgi:hypothetical protein
MAASLENIALTSRVGGLSTRLDPARLLAVAAAALLRVGRRLLGRSEPCWHDLNQHLLADIGETAVSAQREALRNPFDAPLGQIGDGKIDGRPFFARRTSPLG